MTNQEVIEMRTLLKAGKNYPLVMTNDNMFIFDERYDLIIWDDAKGVIYVFRSNRDPKTNITNGGTGLGEIIITDYTNIQMITLPAITKNIMNDIMAILKKNGNINDEQIKFIIDDIYPNIEKYM